MYKLNTKLKKPDWFWFHGSGVRMQDNESVVMIIGERWMHYLNTETMEFLPC